MNFIQSTHAPVFDLGDSTITGYAAPSRGATQVSLWQLTLSPGSTSPLHYMDCEEVFVALAGRAVATVDSAEQVLQTGDCLIVPAGTSFTLHAPGPDPFQAVA